MNYIACFISYYNYRDHRLKCSTTDLTVGPLYCYAAIVSIDSNHQNQAYNFLMSTAHFLFAGRLRDFLTREQKDQAILVEFRGRQSIKHLVESLGVPHPEIGQVRVNGQEGTLNSIAQDGDRVEVWPIPNRRLV